MTEERGRVRAFPDATGPVYFDEETNVYVVSSHEAAKKVLQDAGFGGDQTDNLDLIARLGAMDELSPLVSAMLALFTDGPTHDRLRLAVARRFTPKRVAAMRPRVRALIDAALDGVDGRDEFDVITDLAQPVTLGVIAEMLDIGVDSARVVLGFANRIVAFMELRPTGRQLLDASEAARSCSLFLLPILAGRRESPGDDLLSALLTMELDGDLLLVEEVLTMVVLLMIAGHEAPAHFIANGARALLDDPAERRRLQENPDLYGVAVEELLRLHHPVGYLSRTATKDQVLAGRHIAAGSRVVVDLAAVNRDPARYRDPDRLDILRTDPGHLSFGTGTRYCVGRALGRLEAEETLRRLFARFPDLTLADTRLTRRPSAMFHALDRLPVHPKPQA
ncbi:cytochrome P450 [Spirillospora sp. NPDC048911]|uniref:cytochrome P450 n=1 Tax=Spirillospora sp. NPDC048911 TaxID=3364527 RepID=UPI00370FD1D1